MKGLSPHDRPREKLGRLGPSALGDNELLAIVLGHGARARTALDVANDLLAHSQGVLGLMRLGADELRARPGVGRIKAAQILAALELGRRTLACRSPQRPLLASSREVARFLIPEYSAHGVERFGVVLLDARHRLIRTTILSVGTADASLALPRDVFREATRGGAVNLVVFHNHPSGDPSPSAEDVALTWRLVAAGEVLGVEVVDHVILADASYYSFREAQRLRDVR